MLSQRQRPVFMAVAALVLIWVAAFAGYRITQNLRVTPDKVRAYTASVDFDHLSATDRAAAIQKLAAMLNALTLEERQSLRFDRTYYKWFEKMTEDENNELLAYAFNKHADNQTAELRAEVESLISGAVAAAEAAGIRGKAVTPFLLEQLARNSGGKTLQTNIALLVSNARLAAGIAVAYSDRRAGRRGNLGHYSYKRSMKMRSHETGPRDILDGENES